MPESRGDLVLLQRHPLQGAPRVVHDVGVLVDERAERAAAEADGAEPLARLGVDADEGVVEAPLVDGRAGEEQAVGIELEAGRRLLLAVGPELVVEHAGGLLGPVHGPEHVVVGEQQPRAHQEPGAVLAVREPDLAHGAADGGTELEDVERQRVVLADERLEHHTVPRLVDRGVLRQHPVEP